MINTTEEELVKPDEKKPKKNLKSSTGSHRLIDTQDSKMNFGDIDID